VSLWRCAVERSRAVVEVALAARDLGITGDYVAHTGEHVSLLRSVADLIEEYARHVGHADLLRESVDGRVGEDPPGEWRQ